MPPSRRPPTPAQTLRRSTLALLAFWLLVAGALWWGFAWWDARQRAGLAPYLLTGGELVIPRSPDGHFYVPGEIALLADIAVHDIAAFGAVQQGVADHERRRHPPVR